MINFNKVLFSVIALFTILVAGCTNNDDDDMNKKSEQNNTNQELNTEQTEDNAVNNDNSNDTNGESSEGSNDNNDEHIEHQEGLKMGETGTVVDNDDNKYEVTLNSIHYDADIYDLDDIQTYAVVNVTLENVGDHNFNAQNLYKPSFGPESSLEASLNSVLVDLDDLDVDFLEGEMAQGESVSGDLVFGVAEKNDDYIFTVGNKGQQIKTYSQWEVSDSEID